MSISNVNNNAAAPAMRPMYGVTTSNNNSTRKQAGQGDVAVIAEISEAGRKQTLAQKMYGTEDAPLGVAETVRRNNENKANGGYNVERAEIDPFDNPFQIMCVSYDFPKGSLQEYIQQNLEGKAVNPSLVASELGKMIRGTISNPDGTVEERAANRETALQHVEFIAQNYFSNPEEGQAFIDGVKAFAEKDIMREKGYVVFDNSDMKPFRKYSRPDDSGIIGENAYAEKFGASMQEINSSPEKQAAFQKALGSNHKRWTAEIAAGFESNEKRIADIISQAIERLSETDVSNSLQRILKAF